MVRIPEQSPGDERDSTTGGEWAPTASSSSRTRTRLKRVILAVVAVGIAMRLFNLDKKVYWVDETLGLMRSAGGTTQGLLTDVLGDRITTAEPIRRYQRISRDRGFDDTLTALETRPEHPPLYFLLAWGARTWVHDAPATARALSALISLLVLPAAFWLCLELFESSRVGWTAVALLSVSPLQVLYAQEAKQYTLWALAILVSGAALLRAARQRSPVSWLIYGASVALLLYTHALSVLIIATHAVYVLWAERGLSRVVVGYAASSLLALMAFAPWLAVMVAGFDIAQGNLAGLSDSAPRLDLARAWLRHVTRPSLDLGVEAQGGFHLGGLAAVAGLSLYSVVFLFRRAPQPARALLVLLMVLPTAALIAPDVVLGGVRSMITRYFMPLCLGLQLSLAFTLSEQTRSEQSSSQGIWELIMGGMIACGLLSFASSAPAESWWTKSVSRDNPAIARTINAMARPMLVAIDQGPNIGNLLSLSHLLGDHVRVQLVRRTDTPQLADDVDSVFVLAPTPALRERLLRTYDATLERVPGLEAPELWRLIRAS